jgi:hypothetical protein
MIRSPLLVLGGVFVLASLASAALLKTAPQPGAADKSRPEIAMVEATKRFLSTLTPEQRQAASFSFDSEERFNWQFRKAERKGLPLKEMNAAQKAAALDLLRLGVSARGFEKAATIRELEKLQEPRAEGRGPENHPERYFFSVFGEPSATGNWAWRYEGHHCAMNWTVVGGKSLASTPQFFGTYPAEVRADVPGAPKKGTRPLGAEEDLARKLVNALSAEQRSECVQNGMVPTNIVTGAARQAAIQEDTGIAYKRLSDAQRKMLLDVIHEYTDNQSKPIAERRLEAIRKAGLDRVKFAWVGSTEPGKGHYYRVQGPTFLIEYDNTQNEANHVHSVWRDFKGDFGMDLLGMHYQSPPHRRAATE